MKGWGAAALLLAVAVAGWWWAAGPSGRSDDGRATGSDAPGDLCGARPCIQLGTWNLEWFGTSERDKRPARSRRDVGEIHRWIVEVLDLEVAVLQEVNPHSSQLDWLEAMLSADGYRVAWGESGGEQRVALLWDADEVELADEPRELPVATAFSFPPFCRSGGLRRPLAAAFRAGSFDFVVVGVHLKARAGVTCADRVRRRQAEELFAALPRLVLRTGERDLILAGDFNAAAADPSLSPLVEGTGYEFVTSPAHRAAGSGDRSYGIGRRGSWVDHLALDPRLTGEWVASSTRAAALPWERAERDAYRRQLSDHLPVWASFHVDRDDD